MKVILLIFLLLLLALTYKIINLENFKSYPCSLDKFPLPEYRTCPNMENSKNKKNICNLLKIQCNIKQHDKDFTNISFS